MRTIGKDGKVVRLSKASWDFLIPFDSDPNCAIPKIQARIAELEKKQVETPTTTSATSSLQTAPTCQFNEKKLRSIVKEEMESVIAPFTGG